MTIVAHGVQGQADVPVPLALFSWAAAAVVVLSFAALALAWSRPRWSSYSWRPAHPSLQRLALGSTTVWAVRLLVLAAFVFVAVAAAVGSTRLNQNIAPISVFVLWWVGLVPLSVLLGNVWRMVNPWTTLATLCRIPPVRRSLPQGSGLWPATGLLLLVVWLELVYPTAADVRLMAGLMVGYSLVTLVAMARFGRDAWLDHGEVFSVYCGLLASLSPVEVRGTRAKRRLGFRPPVLASVQIPQQPGLVAFVGVLVGAVSFDGFSGTNAWAARDVAATERMISLGLEDFTAGIVVATIGMLAVVGLVVAAFELAAYATDRMGGLSRRLGTGRVAAAFAHSLVPIAVGYSVAHYFTLFVFQAQDLVRLASDPFGRGDDLFGTSDFRIDFRAVSPEAIWAVQVGAIVLAHVVALMLAHDRALELASHTRQAVRSQYPMLVLMVILTVSGLWFLSEGMHG